MNKADLNKLSNEELLALSYHELDVKTLQQYCDPFVGCWIELDKPITKEEVLQCLKEGKAELIHTPEWTVVTIDKKISVKKARENHIKKVAYFVLNEMREPIGLDVGVPEMGFLSDYFIEDGNHRFAAAIIREDKIIKATLSGSLEYAKKIGLYNPNIYESFYNKRIDKEWKATQRKNKC